MKARPTLTRLPASEEVREAASGVSARHGDAPLDVVGAPAITLYVSGKRSDESAAAFRSLETVGLAFEVAPADDRQVRAELGGRAFNGAPSVARLAASLRVFRDDLARLDDPSGDPDLKERAAFRYQQQLQQARQQLSAILAINRERRPRPA